MVAKFKAVRPSLLTKLRRSCDEGTLASRERKISRLALKTEMICFRARHYRESSLPQQNLMYNYVYESPFQMGKKELKVTY
jgi:hypothetical protein